MTFLAITFEINLSTLLAFITGIACGAVFTVLIATLITLTNIKKENVVIEKFNDEITAEEINEDIKKVKDAFKLKMKEDKEINFNYILNINFQLIRQIATRFYPKSKEPIAELTLEELTLLCHYILNKLDKLMEKGPLKVVRKVKLSWILQMINAKTKIDSTPLIKTARKYKLGKIGKAITTGLQFLNPAMWFRKLVYDPCINLVSQKIVLVLIETVGQETYHIYSKQAFMDPLEEKELQEFINQMNKDNALDIEEVE